MQISVSLLLIRLVDWAPSVGSSGGVACADDGLLRHVAQ
jgi:hypothetical protein